MTLPDERYRAVSYARQFLYDLMDPSQTPRVPKAIRERARTILRHFPMESDMIQASREVPYIFRESIEKIEKIILDYKLEQEEK
jgi:hypothetical protein